MIVIGIWIALLWINLRYKKFKHERIFETFFAALCGFLFQTALWMRSDSLKKSTFGTLQSNKFESKIRSKL